MQIITIYQGASGSGEEIGGAVAEALGYATVDREVVVEASRQYGIPEVKLTEIVERAPTWWATFTRNLEPYRIALQAAFCQLAGDRGIVYHGHIGHELIPKFQHVLKILLTAPIEMRIAQVRVRQQLTEIAARRYVEEVDRARTRRLKVMFGADWCDPWRYDLVVNLGHMSSETATQLIVETARSTEYQMTPASKQTFEDFALVSRVHATLALANDLSHAKVDIKAQQGEISVSGTIPHWSSESHIANQIRNIPGVRNVRADLTKLPPDLGFDV